MLNWLACLKYIFKMKKKSPHTHTVTLERICSATHTKLIILIICYSHSSHVNGLKIYELFIHVCLYIIFSFVSFDCQVFEKFMANSWNVLNWYVFKLLHIHFHFSIIFFSFWPNEHGTQQNNKEQTINGECQRLISQIMLIIMYNRNLCCSKERKHSLLQESVEMNCVVAISVFCCSKLNA